MTPAERILENFDDLSDLAREIIGEALMMQPVPFLSSLGSAVDWSSSNRKLATLVLNRALRRAPVDGSAVLLELLGDAEPWRTIRECLSEAIRDA
jgi:hypothetical protein